MEEAGYPPDRPHHARPLVHHRYSAGPGHRAVLGDCFVGQGNVQVLGAEPGRRDASGDQRLELAVVADATAQGGVVDELAEAHLGELDLVVAGPAYVARQGEDLGAPGTPVPEGEEGLVTVAHDPREV